MKKSLLSSSIAVLIALIICKISAFVQEMIIAAYLGATAIGDAFNTVNGIQETIYPMLSVGISQVFLPAYKSMMVQKNQKKADSLANYAIVFFTGLSIVVVVLLIIFAPLVVHIIAPGFDDSQRELTAGLVRISAVSYVFICCASVLSSILIAHGRFFASEIRGAFTHIPVIIAALLFYKKYGLNALAISLVIAGIARFMILLPFMHKEYRFTLKDPPQRNYLKNLLSRLPSALISSGITQLNTLADKIMASNLAIGSISCLNYGTRLYMVLQELFANVIATSSYPQIIELIAKNKKDELTILINKIVAIIWFFTIPLTVGGIIYSRYLVQLAFVRGAFNSEMGDITASIFVGYIFALAFGSLNGIMNNIYFGFGDTRSPMLFNLLNLILNIGCNFVLIRIFSVTGLALATSISAIVCLIMRVIFLRKKVALKFCSLLKQGIITLGASIVAVGVSYGIIMLIKVRTSIVVCFVAVIISMVVYLIEMRWIKTPVYVDAIQVVKKYLIKQNKK